MKKTIVGLGILTGVVVAVRRFGPKLHEIGMAKCRQMLGLDEIRAQNAAILHALDEQPMAKAAEG